MKLQEILLQFHQDSAQASDIARNLNYALLGVTWILAKENVGNLASFMWPLILIVLSLSSDFFQYFVRGILEKCHYDKQEKMATKEDNEIDEDFDAEPYPLYIQRTSKAFYYTKLGLTAISVIQIIIAISKGLIPCGA